MKKSRITYRIDHSGQAMPYENNNRHSVSPAVPMSSVETTKVIPLHSSDYHVENTVEPLNEFVSDYGDWHSSYDTEVERIERIIKQASSPHRSDPLQTTKRTNTYAAPRSDYHTEYVNHDQAEQEKQEHLRRGEAIDYEEPREYTYRHYPIIEESLDKTMYLRRSRPPWFPIIASITGAAVIGIVFGWFILPLFMNETDPGDQARLPNEYIAQQDTPSPNDSDQTLDPLEMMPVTDPADTSLSVMEQEGVLKVDLPSQSFVVVQHGVFSTIERAQEAQGILQSNGISGVVELKDHYYVYTAITMNRDDAIMLKHTMDEAKLDSLVKDYSIPAVSAIKWQGIASNTAKEYFMMGNELVEVISRLSALQFSKDLLTRFEASSLQTLQELHRGWTTKANELLTSGLSSEYTENVKKMNNAMDSAIVSLEAFNRNPSSSHLWQAQSGITQFILIQRGLLAEMEAEPSGK